MQLEKNIEAIPTGHIHQVEQEHAMTKYGGRGALQRAAAPLFINLLLYLVDVSRWNRFNILFQLHVNAF